MEMSEVTNTIGWCQTRYQNHTKKVGIKVTNKALPAIQEVSVDSLSRPDLLYAYISNGLFFGSSGEWWTIIVTDPAPEQEKKVFTLFRKVTDVIFEFNELKRLVEDVNLFDTDLEGGSLEVTHWTGTTLRWLRQKKLAGSQSALTILGRTCVAADWLLDRVYVLEYELLSEHVVFTTTGLGRDFLVAYINYLSWARQSTLREPVMAAARRAMQLVADNLRLNSSCYYIEVSTL